MGLSATCQWIDSNVWCQRRTAAMIVYGGTADGSHGPRRCAARQADHHRGQRCQAPCPLDKVNREFRVSRPNALWVVDFTYVHTWARFVTQMKLPPENPGRFAPSESSRKSIAVPRAPFSSLLPPLRQISVALGIPRETVTAQVGMRLKMKFALCWNLP